MAEIDPMNAQNAAAEARSRDVDDGLRIYMGKVYNHMAFGLVATALAAYFGASSGLYIALAQTPLKWAMIFLPFGMAMYLSARLPQMKLSSARNLFYIYAGAMGLSLSFVLLLYTGESVITTFLITSASFGALSLYGYSTKRDLSAMGSFLMMGLFGIIIAMVVNLFLASSALQFAISILGVLIFAGLTAYDTQDIKRMYYAGDTRDMAERKAIFGAFRLYLDFINMFLFLLHFMGNRD